MHIKLISVGKLKSGAEKDLVDDYIARFNKSGPQIGFRSLQLISLTSGGGVVAEGERLLAALPDKSPVIRLDEHGPAQRSLDFAKRLERLRDRGTTELCFLIGGAEGYSEAVRAACPETLALGPQTWPHRLVKVMLTEQLYRAVSLLAGLPYHKA
ncbi:MAG: 23S rRNA (pseudouridine(1915)-N(3))-methyltransferase RlmH [Pseudomonadota bacterium]